MYFWSIFGVVVLKNLPKYYIFNAVKCRIQNVVGLSIAFPIMASVLPMTL